MNTLCCSCQNCQTLNRWNALYQKFIKENPNLKDWAEQQQATDQKYLTCFNNNP